MRNNSATIQQLSIDILKCVVVSLPQSGPVLGARERLIKFDIDHTSIEIKRAINAGVPAVGEAFPMVRTLFF